MNQRRVARRGAARPPVQGRLFRAAGGGGRRSPAGTQLPGRRGLIASRPGRPLLPDKTVNIQ